MKKIVSVLLVAVMALSLAVSAFAASGLNKDEEALLAKFNAAVDAYAAISPKHAAQFKAEAENALCKADLDAEACAALSGAIDQVIGYVEANNINSIAKAKAALPAVLGMVNDVVGKFGFSVSVSADGYATVCFNGSAVGGSDKASNGGAKIVKQTGVDMTATVAVVSVLFVALVFGLAVVSKKNLLAKN